MTSPTPAFATLLPVILLHQVIGALGFPITKYGVSVIEPFTFAFYRFLIAGVILLLIVKLQKHNRPVERSDWPKFWLLGFFMIILNQLGYLVGQALTGAGHGSLLYATTPIWVLLLASIHLKERFTLRRGAGVAIAVAGVLIIISGGAVTSGWEYLVGDVIIFIAVLGWAFYSVLGKPLAEKYGALRVTAYALITGSLMYLPLGLYKALTFDYSTTSAGAWAAVLYMSVAMSVIAYVAWYWVLKYMEASRLAVFSNIQPIIAAAVAYYALGEPIGAGFAIGGFVVLAGVIMAELER